jgi:hypothetical protein
VCTGPRFTSLLTVSPADAQRSEFDSTNVPAMYGSAPALLGLVKHAEEDAWLSLALMFHLCVLPLTRQLTCLSGSLWAKTLQGARAQRIEYLLLHEFHSRKFLLPDKLSYREKVRSKPSEAKMPDAARVLLAATIPQIRIRIVASPDSPLTDACWWTQERLAKKSGTGDAAVEENNENGMEGGKGNKGKGPQVTPHHLPCAVRGGRRTAVSAESKGRAQLQASSRPIAGI